jgi:hypothetical protein
MRLNDPIATTFVFKGNSYEIDLAFDTVLDAFDVLKEPLLYDFEKACACLNLLIGDHQYPKDQAVEIWNFVFEEFIHIEEKPFIEYDFYGDVFKVREFEKLMDLSIDAEPIYASFIQTYGIDLIEEQGKLAWPKFRALLHQLPADSPIKKIMQIRVWKPKPGDPNDYQQEMKNLQRYYELDGDVLEEDEEGDEDV